MNDENITAWVTKYALTDGIQQYEGRVCHHGSSKMFLPDLFKHASFHNNDWHRTKESAIAKAEEMRFKKIVSLKRQIEKLEKLRFE